MPPNHFETEDGLVAWRREGAGPPVVLCHGTPWSSRLWDGIAAALAGSHTVYRWDMLGYGESSKHAGQDVSLAAQGQALARLLGHWELDAPHVVAHDYGGAVALRAHLLHGRQYASLALVDVVALSPWGSPFFRLVHDHAQVFEQLPPHLHIALVEAYIRSASANGLADDQMSWLVAPWAGDQGQAAFYRQIAQADEAYTDEIEGRYGTLTMPVHIVWGTDDAWLPASHAHRLHELMPGSGLTLVKGAGHLIQLDAPVALESTLSRWLEQHAHPPRDLRERA